MTDSQTPTSEEKRETEQKFNEILEMFNTPGWKHFVTDTQDTLKQMRDSVNELPDDQIVSGVKFNRGFAACAAYESIVRNNYENYIDEQSGEA